MLWAGAKGAPSRRVRASPTTVAELSSLVLAICHAKFAHILTKSATVPFNLRTEKKLPLSEGHTAAHLRTISGALALVKLVFSLIKH